MKRYLSWFSPRLPRSLVFMLQSSEYDIPEYLAWFWRAPDLRHVAQRGRLDPTLKARLLLAAAWGLVAVLMSDIVLAALLATVTPAWALLAAGLVLALPIFVVYGLGGLVLLGQKLVQAPRERAIIATARTQLAAHSGFRIAIAGSFGKTTFKEILATTLAEAKIVAATPGNMNTPIGISRFIQKLSGKEDILIFELGEYYPGDIKQLCGLVKPQLGIITGINEAHLSKFKTLEATTATIFELADYLPDGPVYKNAESDRVKQRAGESDPLQYSGAGVNGWKVTNIQTGLTGTAFTATRTGHGGKPAHTLKIHSGLLGRHQVGPLVAALDIADRLGLSPNQIAAGLARTRPFEHRLQPRQVAGAWIIDDTYNGNPDGVRAGLAFLAEAEAKRRIYVTPGLVEQGAASQAVHEAIGRDIAAVADVVVLIRNSATQHIEAGLRAARFQGELKVVEDPLRFYENVDQFVAAGDVMLMQNDWTDNYA